MLRSIFVIRFRSNAKKQPVEKYKFDPSFSRFFFILSLSIARFFSRVHVLCTYTYTESESNRISPFRFWFIRGGNCFQSVTYHLSLSLPLSRSHILARIRFRRVLTDARKRPDLFQIKINIHHEPALTMPAVGFIETPWLSCNFAELCFNPAGHVFGLSNYLSLPPSFPLSRPTRRDETR